MCLEDPLGDLAGRELLLRMLAEELDNGFRKVKSHMPSYLLQMLCEGPRQAYQSTNLM